MRIELEKGISCHLDLNSILGALGLMATSLAPQWTWTLSLLSVNCDQDMH